MTQHKRSGSSTYNNSGTNGIALAPNQGLPETSGGQEAVAGPSPPFPYGWVQVNGRWTALTAASPSDNNVAGYDNEAVVDQNIKDRVPGPSGTQTTVTAETSAGENGDVALTDSPQRDDNSVGPSRAEQRDGSGDSAAPRLNKGKGKAPAEEPAPNDYAGGITDNDAGSPPAASTDKGKGRARAEDGPAPNDNTQGEARDESWWTQKRFALRRKCARDPAALLNLEDDDDDIFGRRADFYWGPRSPHLNVVEYLASGAAGAAYRVEDPVTGERFVLKVSLAPYEDEDEVEWELELRAMGMLQGCPGIVQKVEAEEGEQNPFYRFIVMEDCTNGDLCDFLEKNPELDLEARVGIMKQILVGLDQAHRHGLVHHDLKPDNLFLRGNGEVVVGDWGRSHTIAECQEEPVSHPGTQGFMPTEVILQVPHGIAADMFGAGMLFMRILCDRDVYVLYEDDCMGMMVRGWDIRTDPKCFRGYPWTCEGLGPDLAGVVVRMCLPNPAARITAVEAIRLLERIEATYFAEDDQPSSPMPADAPAMAGPSTLPAPATTAGPVSPAAAPADPGPSSSIALVDALNNDGQEQLAPLDPTQGATSDATTEVQTAPPHVNLTAEAQNDAVEPEPTASSSTSSIAPVSPQSDNSSAHDEQAVGGTGTPSSSDAPATSTSGPDDDTTDTSATQAQVEVTSSAPPAGPSNTTGTGATPTTATAVVQSPVAPVISDGRRDIREAIALFAGAREPVVEMPTVDPVPFAAPVPAPLADLVLAPEEEVAAVYVLFMEAQDGNVANAGPGPVNPVQGPANTALANPNQGGEDDVSDTASKYVLAGSSHSSLPSIASLSPVEAEAPLAPAKEKRNPVKRFFGKVGKAIKRFQRR